MSLEKQRPDGCGFRSRFSKENLMTDRRRMNVCLVSVLFWGLAAHAYVFFHNTFSHDSLTEFNAAVYGNDWKMQLGRVFVPAYRFLFRGDLNLPWLIGVLSLIFLYWAVYMTVRIFHIHKNMIMFMLGGIYCANLTVSATAATYINDLDSNMMALLLAVLAVFLWKKLKHGYLFGMVPVCLSLGLYQSYISTTITLILLSMVLKLLKGGAFREVVRKGFLAVGMLIGGGLLYLLAMKGMLLLSPVELKTDNYNSVTGFLSLHFSELPALIGKDYLRTIYRIVATTSAYPKWMIIGAHVVMLLLGGISFGIAVSDPKVGVKERILAVMLLLLVPIAMNVSYILSGGMSHELMHFAFNLIYVFLLLLADRIEWNRQIFRIRMKKLSAAVIVLMTMMILWGNVRLANTLYLKKNMEYDANLAFFTGVMDRMEQTPGYSSGGTPVVFVELPVILLEDAPGFENVNAIAGMWKNYVPNGTDPWSYQAYFKYVLLNPAMMAEQAVWSRMQDDPRVLAMPVYPAEGSVAMIDDVLVVRFGKRFD